MIHAGFTGTRHGMTAAQLDAVIDLMRELFKLDHVTAHHGDCVGADAEFHDVVNRVSFETSVPSFVVVHPPVDDSLRAFCVASEWRTPKNHFARNRDIVFDSDVMIGTPFEPVHQVRGGTWYTVDFAKKQRRPLALVLPAPSGALIEFSGKTWPGKKEETTDATP